MSKNTTNTVAGKTTNKEEKVMKNTKKNAVAVVEEVKVVEAAPVTNEKKVDTYISIEEVTKLYAEAGIKCKNPTAKGNYRIMGGGSSLNVKPKKGYYIYTSDEDLSNILGLEKEFEDLVVEEGTNAQDHARPNTVICTKLDTLKSLLTFYSLNPLNRVAVETTEVATA